MANINLDGLTPAELDALIQKASKAKIEAEAATKKKLRAEFERMAAEAGLTIDAIFGYGSSSRGIEVKEKRKVEAKYANPSDKSETWTGRGRAPKWFVEAEAAGLTRKDMEISH